MRPVLTFLLLIASLAVARAEPLPADEAFALSVSRGEAGGLELGWRIAEGYYLYRDHFRLADEATGAPVAFSVSKGEAKEDPNFGTVEVHHGRATVSVDNMASSLLRVTYQGCQEDGICYRPESRIVDPATLSVEHPAETGAALAGWTNAGGADRPGTEPAAAPEAASGASPEQGLVAALLSEGGHLWVIGSFLVFGLLLAGTPCVFPMYPILAAALARQGEGLTARRGFALSAVYVVFLSLAFGLIGAAAGWTGQNLQILLQSPWTLGVVAAIFVLLALSMFGLFELQLPGRWTTRIAGATAGRGGSYRGMAVLGFSSALIVGPCVTAPLAGALLYIAQTQDWQLGAAALFTLGLGKGIPLILMGTFGAGFLPRAGAWMENVKRLFGFAFVGTAIWLAAPLLPPGLDLALWAVLLLSVAIFAVSFAPAAGMAMVAGRTLGAAAGLCAVLLALGAASGATNPLQPLAHLARGGQERPPEPVFAEVAGPAALDATLAAAGQGGQGTLLYFTADWCVTCHTIERSVLADDGVRGALGPLRLVKADLSSIDPGEEELMKRLGVVGPPSMVFFDAKSREIPGTRLVGEVDVDGLSASARRAGGA